MAGFHPASRGFAWPGAVSGVEGEGTLTFWWKVSSQNNKDWLEFRLDDALEDRISGNAHWQQESYAITGAGPHTLRWRYVKDASKSGGSDCGWVDYVQWTGSYPGAAWTTTAYTYDPAGRRIEKDVDGSVTKYGAAYPELAERDGDQCIAEYDGSDTLLRKYIYGPGVDEPICMIDVADSNAVYYYHYDGLGSVVALSDAGGDTVQVYEYSAFGWVAASDPNHANPFLFTGRRFDAETGLYYYRARYYNPHIGRFLQTDPIGYAGGLNWYAYCGNNPTVLVDPWGLCDGQSGWGDSYLERALKQLVLGDYTEDVTLLGTAAQIAAGLLGVDLPGDIRDIFHSVTHWEWSWGHAAKTAGNAAALLPVLGALRYSDEATALAKGANKAAGADFAKWLNKGPADVSVYKGFNSAGDDVYAGITNSVVRRQREWGDAFEIVEQSGGLTRNQAKAIEQVLLEQNPSYLNKINSISPTRNPNYQPAVDWAKEYMRRHGIQP
jgi:RHS repeat-associated protein